MERQRVEKDKEIAGLRAQQERAKDKQAEKVRTYTVFIWYAPIADTDWRRFRILYNYLLGAICQKGLDALTSTAPIMPYQFIL